MMRKNSSIASIWINLSARPTDRGLKTYLNFASTSYRGHQKWKMDAIKFSYASFRGIKIQQACFISEGFLNYFLFLKRQRMLFKLHSTHNCWAESCPLGNMIFKVRKYKVNKKAPLIPGLTSKI